ncbi:unnamed protein product [Schistocephalus solidus]|uniref:LprI domain-containing protein n=1 Tax=Schistocephalus solidus TaxID=70667 RepID=A0A183S721_SCHSO|nr:unnamed protein product [Schistocephalus solidus]
MRALDNELANWLAYLPVATEDASVEKRWCQLRDTFQSTALDVLEENDASIYSLLVKNNQLHKAYVDRITAANNAAFYQTRHLAQKRLREMQGIWMARKAEA